MPLPPRLCVWALLVAACAATPTPGPTPSPTPAASPTSNSPPPTAASPTSSPPPPTAASPTPSPPPPAPPEASVRPNANAEYLRPDLEVQSWVDRFEREGRDIYDQRHALVRAAGIRTGSLVADVGAGTGLFTMLFSETVGPKGRVYAVDIAPKFLAHIEARARERGATNVTTVRGSDKSANLPPASVDVVFLCDTYHHFEYPRSMLASLRAALRPGGTLLLIDFKRVPGESEKWIFEHVRAGQEVFTAELEAAGFEKVEELPLLRQNYVVKFRKRAN